MGLKRLASAAVVAAVALVPATAASAGHHRHVPLKLALVPLQRAQLGPANASLALNYGSGPTQEGAIAVFGGAANFASGGNGDLGGYALDYGDEFVGSTGVMEIRSSVEAYKTPADARAAVANARNVDKFFFELFSQSAFVKTTVRKVKAWPVGHERFAYRITRIAPNLNPIVKLDEQAAAGRFVLDLTVTAGSAKAAQHAAPHLMLVLHRRLQLVLQRHPAGHRVKLLGYPQAGQAAGGPDLSTLILQPQDVGQSHAVNLLQSYQAAPPALSDFEMILEPAGTYHTLTQQIAWWPTATEATYGETYGATDPFFLFFAFSFGFSHHAAARGGQTITPVDLSSISDPAIGYLITGNGESEAAVLLWNGQAGEYIDGYSKNALQASDVQSLAQAAANRLDAGLGP